MDRKQLYNEYVMVVDSKSIMNKGFVPFLEHYVRTHTGNLKFHMVLVNETYVELVEEFKLSRKERISTFLQNLREYSINGHIEVKAPLDRGSNRAITEEIAIATFVCSEYNSNVALITASEQLARDCYTHCIGSKSVRRSGNLLLMHFKDDNSGSLISWDCSTPKPQVQKTTTPKSQTNTPPQQSKRSTRETTYTMATTRLPLTTLPNTRITVTKPVNVGDEIRFRGVKTPQAIILKSRLGGGGEATVYTTNTQFVVKIFKPEVWTMWRLKKIEDLVKQQYHKRPQFSSVAFPVTVVENTLGEPIGYSMLKGSGTPLELLYSSTELKEKFPNWTRVELAQLCVTILRVINAVHKEGIIIGDINDRNILVKDENNVFFVDTDSYQLNDIPSGVGTPEYTAPELLRAYQSVDYSKFLKLVTDDYFATATLLFKILMRGNYPYSHLNGGTIVQNMKDMSFAYPVGRRTSDSGIPLQNDCVYMWSDLTFDCKRTFAEVFAKTLVVKDETTGKEKEIVNKGIQPEYRHTIEDWISVMTENQKYLKNFKNDYEKYVASKGGRPLSFEELSLAIAKGELKQDPEILNIFPAPHNKRTPGQYAYKCGNCGTIALVDYVVWSKHPDLFKYCSSCSKKISTKRVCSVPNCSQEFEITLEDQQYFVKKGLLPPTRCPFHRKRSNTRVDEYIQFTDNDDNKHGNSGSSNCFLTTATCVFLGKPDDCEELKALREFRDTWLAKQPKGLALIADYYAVAPKIVEGIAKSGNANQEYSDMYYKYIVPCMGAVHEKNFQKCNELYMEMYNDLKKRYYNGPQLKFEVKVKSLKELDEIFNSKRVAEIMTVVKEENSDVPDSFDDDVPLNSTTQQKPLREEGTDPVDAIKATIDKLPLSPNTNSLLKAAMSALSQSMNNRS